MELIVVCVWYRVSQLSQVCCDRVSLLCASVTNPAVLVMLGSTGLDCRVMHGETPFAWTRCAPRLLDVVLMRISPLPSVAVVLYGCWPMLSHNLCLMCIPGAVLQTVLYLAPPRCSATCPCVLRCMLLFRLPATQVCPSTCPCHFSSTWSDAAGSDSASS